MFSFVPVCAVTGWYDLTSGSLMRLIAISNCLIFRGFAGQKISRCQRANTTAILG